MSHSLTHPFSDENLRCFQRYSPLRIVNGFIAIDLVWGCYRCSFCFNRENFPFFAQRPRAFEIDLHEIESAVRSCAALEVGTVVKIGHNSDVSLFDQRALELLERFEEGEALFALYRRRPIPGSLVDRYAGLGARALLVVTLTPGSELLEHPEKEAWATLSSTRSLPHVFYEIRPIARDSIETARALFARLPPKSTLDICGLIESAGGRKVAFDGSRSAPPSEIESLRTEAAARGHRINCAVNCLLRGRAGLGSHWRPKYFSDPELHQNCEICPGKSVCSIPPDEKIVSERLRNARERLGLPDLELVELDAHSISLRTRQEVARGDQTYLRNLLNAGVQMVGQEGALVDAPSPKVARRWDETSFFPVRQCIRWSRQMAEAVGHIQ